MIKFAILSDNKNIRYYEDIIDKFMMRCDMFYEKISFNDKDKRLNEFLESNSGLTVYIINNNLISGVEFLNRLRGKYNDYNSFIIIIDTNDEKSLPCDIGNDFMIDVIKNDVCFNLEKDLNSILVYASNQKKCLSVYQDKMMYKIPFSQILYIEKKLNSKKVNIVCKENVFEISKSLIEMEKLLDNRFVKSHQSAIVNLDNIKSIDFYENCIEFINCSKCNLLSRSNKKLLKGMLSK